MSMENCKQNHHQNIDDNVQPNITKNERQVECFFLFSKSTLQQCMKLYQIITSSQERAKTHKQFIYKSSRNGPFKWTNKK